MIGKAGTALVAYPNANELGCRAIEESTEPEHAFGCLPQATISRMHRNGKRKRTMDKAALVDRMVGLSRGAFGTGGGRAATWGDAALAERASPVGTTTGGASLKRGGCWDCLVSGMGGCAWGPETADIMAWRWEVKARGERRAEDKDERGREDNMDDGSTPTFPYHALSTLGMTNHHIDISTDGYWLADPSQDGRGRWSRRCSSSEYSRGTELPTTGLQVTVVVDS